MSDNPISSNSLGESYALIGFKYDPSGADQFKRVLRDLALAQQQFGQQQIQTTQVQQRLNVANTDAARIARQVEQAEQRVALARVDNAGRVEVYRTALQRLNTTLQTTIGDEQRQQQLRLQALRTQEQLIRAENRLSRERIASARAAIGGAVGGLVGGGALGSLAGGVLGGIGPTAVIGLASGQVAGLARAGYDLRVSLDQSRRSLGAFLGDMDRGNRIFERATAAGHDLGFTQQQTAQAIQASTLLIRNSHQPVEQIITLLTQLQALAPEQGIEGAAFALRELAGGDIVSLTDRFNINRQAVNKWKAEIQSGGDVVEVVSRGLRDDLGLSLDIIKTNLEGATGAQRRHAQALEDFKIALGDFVEGPGTRFIEWTTAALSGLASLFSGKGLGFFSQIQSEANKQFQDLLRSSQTYDEFQQRILARAKELQARADTNSDAVAAAAQSQVASRLMSIVQPGILDDRAKAIIDDTTFGLAKQAQAHAAARDAAQQNANAMLDLARGQQQTSSTTVDLAKNQAALADSLIQAGEQIQQQERQRNERLADLDRQHVQRHQEILNQITQAEQDGITERVRIVTEGQQRITDAVIAEQLRANRQAEDRRDEDLAAESDYQQRRQEVIDRHHDQEVKDEADYQRELARAQRQGQLDQYRSTADFLERLYSLTRGRRNKAELEQARAQLQGAQAEAAELAKTDPAAAAALLAERQRQINDALQRRRDEAQLRRDAKRGGGLSSADVEQEIADENAVRQQANQLAIDAIKQGAKDRADDRTREKQERDQAFQGQLDDLDHQEAERRAKLEQSREKEDRRRAEDYAKQLQDLRNSNQKQLREFEQNQRDKIAKLKAGLKQEDDEYTRARQKVLDDYDRFIADLKDKLQKQANNLILTPDQQRQAELAAMYETLGNALGLAFARGVQTAAGQALPPAFAPGGIQGTGSAYNPPGTGQRPPSEVAVTPGQTRAAQSIITGGNVISNYGADRSRLRGPGAYHQGMDVGGKRGDPIHALFSGTARGPYTDPSGGNVLYIEGEGQWKGITAYYAHMEGPPLIRSGHVSAGAIIGRVGTSGDAKGGPSHVHVELIQGGQDLNPAQALAGYYPAPSPPPGGATGSKYTGQSYRAQAIQRGAGTPWTSPLPDGFTIWDRPDLHGGYAPGGAPVSYERSLTLDLRGATFGPGLSETQLRGWLQPVLTDAIVAFEQKLSREADDLSTRGSLR